MRLFLLLLASILAQNVCSEPKIVCYYTNWAQYRSEGGKFFPENIDPNLCTHIHFSFAKIVNGKLAPFEWNDEDSGPTKGMYSRIMNLKTQNPNLKVLLAVGGWNMGSTDFSKMASSSQTRSTFISTTIDYLKSHGFDGLDLDWEYPTLNAGAPSDKPNFSLLCQELKAALAPKNLLLSAAVGIGKSTIDSAYQVAEISKHLDYINLMTYDIHGSWESFTGHNAPLFARADETDVNQLNLNVDFAVKYYIKLGAPKEKLHLGLGTYGRSYTLADSNKNKLGSQAKGPGTPGTFTKEAGFLAYYEVCQNLKQGWKKEWNSEQLVPYAFNGDQWVGYDDVDSLKEKVKYMKNLGLGGVLFWTLDLDDFDGKYCGQGKYPLINAVKSELKNGQSATTTSPTKASPTKASSKTASPTKASSTTASPTKASSKTASPTKASSKTASPTKASSKTASPIKASSTRKPIQTTKPTGFKGTTTAPSSDNLCYKGDGSYPDKTSGCKKYYTCIFSGTSNNQIYYMECPKSTLFDERLGICNYALYVKC